MMMLLWFDFCLILMWCWLVFWFGLFLLLCGVLVFGLVLLLRVRCCGKI